MSPIPFQNPRRPGPSAIVGDIADPAAKEAIRTIDERVELLETQEAVRDAKDRLFQAMEGKERLEVLTIPSQGRGGAMMMRKSTLTYPAGMKISHSAPVEIGEVAGGGGISIGGTTTVNNYANNYMPIGWVA